MKIHIILIVMVLSVIPTQPFKTRLHHNQHHGVAEDCCAAHSGKLCGRLFTSCCKKGCESSFLGEFCINGEQIQTDCTKLTCLSVCKSKGGKACGVSVSKGSVDCCLEQDCKKSAQKGTTITDTVGNGIIETAKSKILGLIFHEKVTKQQQEHQYFVDTVLEKALGRNDICQLGKSIDLGNCIIDDSMDLLKARNP